MSQFCCDWCLLFSLYRCRFPRMNVHKIHYHSLDCVRYTLSTFTYHLLNDNSSGFQASGRSKALAIGTAAHPNESPLCKWSILKPQSAVRQTGLRPLPASQNMVFAQQYYMAHDWLFLTASITTIGWQLIYRL